MTAQQMSNSTWDRMLESVHRPQRVADALRADLPRCKSIEERRRSLEAIARLELRAKEAHAELVAARGW